jgi:hypothetical protein
VKTVALLFILLPLLVSGQDLTEDVLIARLQSNGNIAEDVLSKRSVVLHSFNLSSKEINTIHENLVRTGIDAIGYFEIDMVLGGKDMTAAYSKYFTRREVANLVLVQKTPTGYRICVTSFNNENDLVKQNQPAWITEGPSLSEALTLLYRTALASNHKRIY